MENSNAKKLKINILLTRIKSVIFSCLYTLRDFCKWVYIKYIIRPKARDKKITTDFGISLRQVRFAEKELNEHYEAYFNRK